MARHLFRFASTATCAVMFASYVGCDKVETLVTEAKQEIAPAPAPAPAPVQAPVVTPTPTPATPEPPPPPSADQVLAEFNAINGALIDDAVLMRLLSSPEAAAQITELNLSGNQRLSGAGLQLLAKLPNLKSVTLNGINRFTPADFAVFTQTANLVSLDLTSTQLTDQHLAAAAEAKSLTKVVVANNPVSATSIGQLAALPALIDLDASRTQANDATVAEFAKKPMVNVNLNFTQVTDQSLVILGAMPSLEQLSAGETQVTGLGFQKPAFTNLKALRLAKNRFGVEGLMAIRKLAHLEELELFSCGILLDNGRQVDNRANVFKNFKNLKSLNISGNGVTDLGLASFIAGHKSLETLYCELGKGVTDQGFVRLSTCPKLTHISVRGSSVTPAGVNAIKTKLKEVKVDGDFGSL